MLTARLHEHLLESKLAAGVFKSLRPCRPERKPKTANAQLPQEADSASTMTARMSLSGATESSRSHCDDIPDSDTSLDKVKASS